MRTPPYPPADMPAALRPLHDEMDAYITEHLKGFVSHRADGALVGPFAPIFDAFKKERLLTYCLVILRMLWSLTP